VKNNILNICINNTNEINEKNIDLIDIYISSINNLKYNYNIFLENIIDENINNYKEYLLISLDKAFGFSKKKICLLDNYQDNNIKILNNDNIDLYIKNLIIPTLNVKRYLSDFIRDDDIIINI
jgi:hypothetical protein